MRIERDDRSAAGAEAHSYHQVRTADHAVGLDRRVRHDMALDDEAQRFQQRRRLLRVRCAIAGRIVGRNANQLGQEPLGIAAVRGDERMDRDRGVGQETPAELRGGVNDAMNRARTRAPAATSASVTASAGLWLIPALQRTNSMPIGAIAMIAMPS